MIKEDTFSQLSKGEKRTIKRFRLIKSINQVDDQSFLFLPHLNNNYE